MKLFISHLFIFLILINLSCSRDRNFQKVYSPVSNLCKLSLAESNSGYMLFASSDQKNGNRSNICISVIDKKGNLLPDFPKCMDTNADEYVTAVSETLDDQFILTGYTSGNYSDLFILKIDEVGDTVNGPPTYLNLGQKEVAMDIARNGDQGYVIFGTISKSPIASDFLLQFINNDGTPVKNGSKNYDSSIETGYAITSKKSGGFAMAGTSIDQTNDFWLINTDAKGEKIPGLAVRRYDGGGSEICYSIIQAKNNNLYLLGYTQNKSNNNDIWLVITDSVGNEMEHSPIRFDYGYDDVGIALVESSDGELALLASSNNGSNDDVILIQTDGLGNETRPVQRFDFGQNEYAQDIIATSDGGFLIAVMMIDSLDQVYSCLVKTE